jgi:hypothetical protein
MLAYALDIETYGEGDNALYPKLSTIKMIQYQAGYINERNFFIPSEDIRVIVHPSKNDIQHFLNVIQSTIWIGQNLSFDIAHLFSHAEIAVKPKIIYDTKNMYVYMLNDLILNNVIEKSNNVYYSSLSNIHYNLGLGLLDKKHRDDIFKRYEIDDKDIEYGKKDVEATVNVYNELNKLNNKYTAYNFMHFTYPIMLCALASVDSLRFSNNFIETDYFIALKRYLKNGSMHVLWGFMRKPNILFETQPDVSCLSGVIEHNILEGDTFFVPFGSSYEKYSPLMSKAVEAIVDVIFNRCNVVSLSGTYIPALIGNHGVLMKLFSS